ncbi:MAG: hypothetical protein HYV07_18435 [Deltaproteobacteria bacterium]|nr:hypothetical protein [Deltaproteobacteria bacterium]
MSEDIPVQSIVFVFENGADLPELLEHAFSHPWVTTYQIGFGPPLVRASAKLVERLKGARTTFDKLREYVSCCVLDREECRRLADLHIKLLARRFGPLEAEDVDRYSADALDLSLRLFDLGRAPPEVVASMRAAKLDTKWPAELGFDDLGARFLVRLSDPRNLRMLELAELRNGLARKPVDPKPAEAEPVEVKPTDVKPPDAPPLPTAVERAPSARLPPPLPSKRAEPVKVEVGELELGLELRVPIAASEVFATWASEVASSARVKVTAVALGRLPPRVRVRRDGEQL